MSARAPFASLPFEEREGIISFVCQKFGWHGVQGEARAVKELMSLDHVGLAYLKVDMRSESDKQGHRVDYDPTAEMFREG